MHQTIAAEKEARRQRQGKKRGQFQGFDPDRGQTPGPQRPGQSRQGQPDRSQLIPEGPALDGPDHRLRQQGAQGRPHRGKPWNQQKVCRQIYRRPRQLRAEHRLLPPQRHQHLQSHHVGQPHQHQHRQDDLHGQHRGGVGPTGEKENRFPGEQDKVDSQRRRRQPDEAETLGGHLFKLIPAPLLDVISRPGQQHHPQGGDDADQNGFDLDRRVIVTHLPVGLEKPQHDGIQLGVEGGGAGHGEKHTHRPQVPPQMIVPHRPQPHKSPGVEKVQNTGTGQGDQTHRAVYQNIFRAVDQGKDRPQAHHFKEDGPGGDVGVLFQGLIEPLHPDSVEKDGQAHDKIQLPFSPQFGHRPYQGEKCPIGRRAHDEVEQGQLLHRPG